MGCRNMPTKIALYHTKTIFHYRNYHKPAILCILYDYRRQNYSEERHGCQDVGKNPFKTP